MTVSTLTLRQTKGARLTTVEMDNNWLYCSDSSNATFAQSGTGAVSTPTQDELRALGARPEAFGAIGDGTTDDNVALQKWLNRGGRLYLPAGKTYKNTAANLTGVANTEIYLAAGSVLLLNTTRLSFLSVNNVKIYGPGKIQSMAMNTSDSLPTDWQGRGIVEFGGSASALATDFQIVGVEVQGEWTTSTPTGTGHSKKRGIYVVNVSRALIQGNRVHNIVGEAIIYEDGNSAAGVDCRMVENTVHDCDHNALCFNTLTSVNTVCTDNTVYNAWNGWEGGCGVVSDNTFDTLANGAITAGASSKAPGDLSVSGNTIRNATGKGMSLGYNAGTAGIISITDNNLTGIGDSGIEVTITTVVCEIVVVGNAVRNYGTAGTTNRRGISISGTGGGYVGGNMISTPAANGQYGLDVATSSATKVITIGPNAVDLPGTQPYASLQSNAGAGAEQQLWYGKVFPVSVTGTLTETSFWKKTMLAKSISDAGGYKVTATGTASGANNTKTFKLKWGGSTICTLTEGAADQNSWRIEAIISARAATNSQSVSVRAWNGTTLSVHSVTTTAIDTSSAHVLELTATLANTGDTAAGELWCVEPFNLVKGID